MLDVLIHRLRLGAAGMATAALAVGLSSTAQAQTLVTWDDYTDVGQNVVIEQLNKSFVAAHPGVTINRTARTFDDLSMTLKLR
jgi:raffinose/stachyose/melibiose transport system substrate-binding protein